MTARAETRRTRKSVNRRSSITRWTRTSMYNEHAGAAVEWEHRRALTSLSEFTSTRLVDEKWGRQKQVLNTPLGSG